jgi:prephenate dehydrogenase
MLNLPLERRHSNPETRGVYWKRITLVGVGLLGGSLGLALKQRHLAGAVVGWVRRAASVRELARAGAVDEATRDLATTVTGCDTTRIASSSPEMWRDIVLANRSDLLRTLNTFVRELRNLRGWRQSEDGDAISRFFQQARQRRDLWVLRAAPASPGS